MVLKGDCVDEALFSTDLTLVDNIPTRAGLLVELVIIPLLQSLVAGGTFNLFVCILLSVLSFHSMVPLHDMGVQCLFVLRRVVATLPVAREPYVLSFPMLLPCVLVQQVFVAVPLSTGCAHVLF